MILAGYTQNSLMPAKNTVKIYAADTVYHIYNRGVEKRTIFTDDYDYKVFLNCLKEALLSPEKLAQTPKTLSLQGSSLQMVVKPAKNFAREISLLAYCLMPNHFHLLVRQTEDRAIDSFMRSIGTRYAIHFNKRHKRVGHLFQGIYKAAMITDEPYYLHITRYIHRNPLKYTNNLIDAYSSYAEYLGKRKTAWIKPDDILASFQPSKFPFLKHTNSYEQFVEFDRENENILTSDFTLEDDTL